MVESSRKDSYTLAILVNNKSGVLMRVVALFSRRRYNIDSLSVSETESPDISRITIVVHGDRAITEQIIRQVEKLIDVRKVYEMTSEGSIQRELVLIKLSADEATRTHLVEIGELFPEEGFGIRTGHHKARVKAPVRPGAALPEQVVVLGAVGLVHQAAVGVGGDLPAIVISGIGVGEGLIVHRNGAVGGFGGVEVDHWLAGGRVEMALGGLFKDIDVESGGVEQPALGVVGAHQQLAVGEVDAVDQAIVEGDRGIRGAWKAGGIGGLGRTGDLHHQVIEHIIGPGI